MAATPPYAMVQKRYQLGRVLGHGASSAVYLAVDTRIGRQVALKRIDLTQLDLGDRKVGRVDLAIREAGTTAASLHPRVVGIHDVFEENGQAWLVLEYVPGGTLADRIAASGGSLDVAFLARIGSEVAEVLVALQAKGIVHRDIKPANILLDQDGSARVADFGVASALDVWTLGGVAGTPGYMAPEVWHGAPATPASDVYSLGATLYTALTGHHPERPIARAPEIGGRAVQLIVDALDADPSRRPEPAELRDGLAVAAEKPRTLVEEPWGAWEEKPARTRQDASAGEETPDGDTPDVAPRPSRVALGVVATIAVILVVLGATFIGSRDQPPTSVPPGASALPTATTDGPTTSVPAPVDAPAGDGDAPPRSAGAGRWDTFWAEAWYSPFAIFRWAYDDGVPADAGFFRGVWWFVRLIVALVSAVLLDVPLTLTYVTAAVTAVLVGPGPAHVLVGPLFLVWLGVLAYRFLG